MRLGFADDPFWRGRAIPNWARPVTRTEDGLHCRYDLVGGETRIVPAGVRR